MAHFNFNSYLGRHKIKLSPKAKRFCKLGLQRMAKSIDPLHNHLHVICILQNLGKLLAHEKESVKSETDFNVLLMSIIWHDIWKSYRFPTGLLKMLWQQAYEGRGSAKIVAAEMKKAGFPKETIKKVTYAIQQHATVHKKHKTAESKILSDLDELDRWRLNRVKQLYKVLNKQGKLNLKILTVGKFYAQHFMKNAKPDKLYFSWSRREFPKLKERWIKTVKTFYELQLRKIASFKIPN